MTTRGNQRRRTVIDGESAGSLESKWQFSSEEELVSFLADRYAADVPTPTSIRGTVSTRGRYARRREDGWLTHTSGRPILDSISSPVGEVKVGNRVLQVGAAGGALGFDRPLQAASFECTTMPNGLEVCTSDDGSEMTISSDSGSVRFKSWRGSKNLIGYWEVGTKITTTGGDFEAARIDSRYYDTAYAQTCAVVKYDNDSDTNDDHVDEYEWGLGGSVPKRVESLCRVQWQGQRLSGIVGAGSLQDCLVVGDVQPFPTGWPEDWPPLPEPPTPPTLTVSPRSLRFRPRATDPTMTKSVRITSTFPDPVNITVDEAELNPPSTPIGFPPITFQNPFSNQAGSMTVPANGSLDVPVAFNGSANNNFTTFGAQFAGELRIRSDNRTFVISLDGQVLPVVVLADL